MSHGVGPNAEPFTADTHRCLACQVDFKNQPDADISAARAKRFELTFFDVSAARHACTARVAPGA